MKFPYQKAYKLAQHLKEFRARLDLVCYSGKNPMAVQQAHEVTKNINWDGFDQLIIELEYAYKINNNIT